MDEHQIEPVTSSSSLGQPWAHEPCTLRLFIPLSPSASLSFLLFLPFPLFVYYFQSFLSSLFLLYLFPLLRCSVPLLCSLHERRSGKCCNLVLISYLAGDKQQRSKETTGILFENATGPLGPQFNLSKKINQLQFLIGIRSQLKVPLLKCNNESARSRSCCIQKTFCQLFMNNSTKLITAII